MAEINHDWLRHHGFKYEDDPQGIRRWFLQIGRAIPDKHRSFCSDDFGFELVKWRADDDWSLFLRADYAGRYSRFLFCRKVNDGDDVIRIIDAIIYPRHFVECFTPYGFLTSPDEAQRMAAESERMDLRLARQYAKATGEDPDKVAR